MNAQNKLPFHALTVHHNRRVFELFSEVAVAQAFNPKTSGLIQPYFKDFRALWDTGATRSVITQRVVEQCDLKQIGMTIVAHTEGKSWAEVYVVDIGLPNRVRINGVRVTKGKLEGFHVIIGMDIITLGDLAITNTNGETVFSFRIPSIERIDYVKESKKRIPKVRPKDPCPCGSKKKYKNCCGNR